MMPAKKLFALACLTLTAFVLASCSGVPGGNSGGGGGTGSTFSISVTVTGLSGSGLVLQNNGKDNLAISANGTFTFKTPVTAYLVTVLTQPSNPTQTCAVTGGSGTATANVTSVAVACTTNAVTATIGGTVSGLVDKTGVILQNNGGDSLTITANGPFTFKTPVTGPTDAYAVTVLTQPVGPNQICTVASGSGTASADVTNVSVTCVLSYTIGGTVTGVQGTGLVLQNSSDNELLPISPANGNQAFTFKNLVPTGTTYTVSISVQPTGPIQTCVVTPSTASGTATGDVTSVVVSCPAVTYSIGGNVVGLAGVPPTNGQITDNSFVLQNVLGNTQIITENGPFTFATPEALNDQYQLSVFHGPSTQYQGCTLWDYKGVVTANVTNILVDCGHNDWTWIEGTKVAGVVSPAAPVYGAFASTAPPSDPNPYTNTPGARYGAAGWTNKHGDLFLFGGDGWELSGKTPPDTLTFAGNDLWVCQLTIPGTGSATTDYCQWQLIGGYDPAATVFNGTATTIGKLIIGAAQNVNPYPATVPPGRLGTATWTDTSGNFWLFGGSNGNNFRNDLWKYDTSSLTPSTYTTTEGVWTMMGGSNFVDQPGVYSGTPFPGARTNAVTWTDAAGNFWLFGGYGYDGQSTPILGFLNDLWEYTGGHWVFVSGGNTNIANQNGIYAAATNMPGGRQEAVGWADAHGNLWLFGGEGLDSAGTPKGILNDLWVYNISTNQWTFVMGSTLANQTGEYGVSPFVGPPNTTTAAGTLGISTGDPTTRPGSRWGAAGWIDQGGDLWLFGGWGLDSTGTNGNGALNDLWVYVPNSSPGQPGTWTWLKGSNTGSANGIYGAGITRPYLVYEIWTPGGRSNSTHWVDNLGQFWLYGGEGYDSTSTTGNGYLNDMWRYLPYATY